MIDIPTLITKLRNAPRKVGTFGRGDTKPLDEFAPLMTGEERDWLIDMAYRVQVYRESSERLRQSSELDRLKRTSGEG